MTGGAASVGTRVCPLFLQRPGPGMPCTHLLTDLRSSVTARHSFTARREMRNTVQPTRPLLEPGRDWCRVRGPGEDLPGPGEDGGRGEVARPSLQPQACSCCSPGLLLHPGLRSCFEAPLAPASSPACPASLHIGSHRGWSGSLASGPADSRLPSPSAVLAEALSTSRGDPLTHLRPLPPLSPPRTRP